jgi:biotin-dependent carboxylase-like uncharacterized protein
MSVLEVLRIAPLSGVQDSGRHTWRDSGVPRSGPLDDWSCAVANVLVGNAPDTAVLEIGFGRSQLRFEQAAVLAICGARTPAEVNGVTMPLWRPFWLPAGSILTLAPALLGSKSYLALAGGLQTAVVLGSRSALMQATGFPQMLRRGDCIAYTAAAQARWRQLFLRVAAEVPGAVPWWADGEPLLDLDGHAALRVIEGAHVHLLRDRRALYTSEFSLSSAANRMAAPLCGQPLAIDAAGLLISEPVVPGTIQLPPDGMPLILLAEAQTVGGYPRIGHVASVDLARLAQRRPGARIRFEPISLELARRLWIWRRERLMRLRIAVSRYLEAVPAIRIGASAG